MRILQIGVREVVAPESDRCRDDFFCGVDREGMERLGGCPFLSLLRPGGVFLWS
jgi:hypothetical protein